MREELTAALTEVGVVVGPGASAETLARAATAWMTTHNRTLDEVMRRQDEWREAMRNALVRAGRDPGAHALTGDMLAELIAVADGRIIP